MNPTETYAHRGIRALVLLHETHLREFCATWKRAADAELVLPDSEDPAYASLDALLGHVLGAARGYMAWCCETLEVPDPALPEPPSGGALAQELDAYLERLLAGWGPPLAEIDEKTADRTVRDSSWGVPYCVDSMLEHAVMHPIRHRFQLEELLTTHR